MARTRALSGLSAAVLLGVALLCGGCGSGAAPGPTALQDLESALGEQGRTDFRDTFGTLALDTDGGRVLLYATDDVRARELVDGAARAHPGIETGRTAIRQARYARAVTDPAIDRIMAAATAGALPLPVYTAGLLPGA
ncbi:hypothetical protein ACGFZP_03225 [Kitasatospora sp. NPDC048239]|uniref:hypothetical protein n=1 Tax=Kitasatospora sp. NPDC048239 TaxID=3364046 RepID=UPI00371BAEBC